MDERDGLPKRKRSRIGWMVGLVVGVPLLLVGASAFLAEGMSRSHARMGDPGRPLDPYEEILVVNRSGFALTVGPRAEGSTWGGEPVAWNADVVVIADLVDGCTPVDVVATDEKGDFDLDTILPAGTCAPLVDGRYRLVLTLTPESVPEKIRPYAVHPPATPTTTAPIASRPGVPAGPNRVR